MRELELDGCRVRLGLEGASRYQKVSFPPRYGRRHEVETRDFVFQYNLNGEIRYIRGKTEDWPHPSEWLKRTDGSDWVYYGSGGYSDVYDVYGEYYVPFVAYATNSLRSWDPFGEPAVQRALEAWTVIPRKLPESGSLGDLAPLERASLEGIRGCTPHRVREKAETLFDLLGGRVSVLPPDARHVDYDCIPLAVADGCLYNCSFCRVKSGQGFRQRSLADVRKQLRGLQALYGPDAANYNSLFLAHHDALNCDPGLLEAAAAEGLETLGLRKSSMEGANLFLFGSVDSLLRAPEELFGRLQAMGAQVFLNVGLESAHGATLRALGKPLEPEAVAAAFERMLDINARFRFVEATGNFVLSADLPAGHFDSVLRLAGDVRGRRRDKGTVYLSSLHAGNRREQMRLFREVKRSSRLPVFMYLIQRL
jgi:hypothetical protein